MIKTDRLVMRRVGLDDVEELFRIFSNEILFKYFVSGADTNLEDTENRIKKVVAHWQEYDFGDYKVLDKDTNQLIGYGGLHYKEAGGNINISYIVAPEHWGHGYGQEICLALIDQGFSRLGLDKIVAEIDPKNNISVNLVEKSGFKFNRKMSWKGVERLEYVLYNPKNNENNIKDLHNHLNDIYHIAEKDYQVLKSKKIKCKLINNAGNYITFDGEYHYQKYPIPIIEVKDVGDIGYNIDSIFFEFSIKRERFLQTDFRVILDNFANVQVYGGQDCLTDFYKGNDCADEIMDKVKLSYEEDIMLALYFDYSEDQIVNKFIEVVDSLKVTKNN